MYAAAKGTFKPSLNLHAASKRLLSACRPCQPLFAWFDDDPNADGPSTSQPTERKSSSKRDIGKSDYRPSKTFNEPRPRRASNTDWYTDDDSRPSRSRFDTRKPYVSSGRRNDRTYAAKDTLPRTKTPSRTNGPVEASDNFESVSKSFRERLTNQDVISRDSWEKLIALIQYQRHAHEALQLMKEDAAVREAVQWDWSAQGYGQLVLSLVAAASSVGEHSVAEDIVAAAGELHLNTSGNTFLSGIMRKMVGAGAESKDLRTLYDMERQAKGKNTHMAAHELSRALRKEEDIEGVKALLQQVSEGKADMKDDLQEALQIWLSKRGVAV